jgi:chorismate mutase
MSTLSSLRQQIDEIDTQVLKLLAKRFHIVKYVAASKLTRSKHDPEREKRMLDSWLKQIEGTDLEPKFTKELLKLVTTESKRFQSEIYNEE